jgi:uncharacterized protein YcbX
VEEGFAGNFMGIGSTKRNRYQKAHSSTEASSRMTQAARIDAIFRYPVKGLSPEPLRHTHLEVGATLPSDRRYAIENGPSNFDPAAPRYQPKQRYLMLMRNERLAMLQSHFDDASTTLSIRSQGREVARGDLSTVAGRAALELFFAAFCAAELRGPPRLLQAPGFSFSDVASKVVSIINLASLAAVETVVGAPVHPLRFRGNVYVSGWPAWSEFDLIGREIALGNDARLRIVKRIKRCAATDVDPDTGTRGGSIPQTLQQTFGHNDFGVYGEVVEAGDIAVGDTVVA